MIPGLTKKINIIILFIFILIAIWVFSKLGTPLAETAQKQKVKQEEHNKNLENAIETIGK